MFDSVALKYYRLLRIPSKMARYVSLIYPLYLLLIVLIDLIPCIIKNYYSTVVSITIVIHVLCFSL
ncbi:MAG: hypothetical protein QW646_02405, partial [Ignisphaera sp.]